MSTTFTRRARAAGLIVAIAASTLGFTASPASAGTGGCSFTGHYGVSSKTPYTPVANQQITTISLTGFVDVTGCTVGQMTVTGVPIAGVSGNTEVALGTPMTCFIHVPHVAGLLEGTGCASTLFVSPAVAVNTVNILLTAEVVLVATNGGYAIATASCVATFDHWDDPVGVAGPRCPISG